MNGAMSCDEVFDVLTRGPFPTGSSCDRSVELHLAACHGCRELAEALRPALNLFHESVPCTEESDLPTYRGRVEELVAEVSIPGGERSIDGSPNRVRFMVTGGLVGLATSLVLWMGTVLAEPIRTALTGEQPVPGASSPEASSGQSGRGEVGLESIALPRACLPPRQADTQSGGAERLTLSTLQQDYACCTRCHYSGGTSTRSAHHLRVVTTACTACHESAPKRDDCLGLFFRPIRSPRC